MQEDNKMKRDLAGVLKAIESNNAIQAPEEREKREVYANKAASEANASLIKPLRTFESDAAEAIKQEHQSVYSIAQAEKAKHPKPKERDPEKEEVKKNGLLLILSGVLFLAGGIFVLYLVLIKFFLPSLQDEPSPVISSLIPSKYERVLEDPEPTRGAIAELIRMTLAEPSDKNNSVQNIQVTKQDANMPLSTILQDIAGEVPPALLRAFNDEVYMIGSVHQETQIPFFIIKIEYYENAFAGMLEWETQLEQLFAKLTGEMVNGGVVSDAIVKNKDVRIFKDSLGVTQAVYSFYDKETLVLAADESSLGVVIDGIRTSKLVR